MPKKLIKYILVLLPVLILKTGWAQETGLIIDSTYVSGDLGSFLSEINKKGIPGVFYDQTLVPEDESINLFYGESVISFLEKNLEPYGLFIITDHQGNIYITNDENLRSALSFNSSTNIETSGIQTPSRDIEIKGSYAASIFTIGGKSTGTQKPVRVTGKALKEEDMQPVIGGMVTVEETGEVVTTDRDGYFVLNIPPGKYTLLANSMECEPRRVGIDVRNSGEFSFTLPPRMVLLDEVVIRSDLYQKVRSTKMGIEKLSVKTVKEIPVVLGEKDIVKVAMLLPGVQSAGEGTSGFNVRGSPADQNLFYLNNIPIYNTSHLFGFFSALNSEAVSEFSLYKSNIPARYGGRLASVFDVTTLQGRHDKFKLSGGISPVSGMVIAEGPVFKSKASYLISARSTYSDWLLNMIRDPQLKMSDAAFSDFMVNISTPINPNNDIQVVGYYSRDNATLSSISDHNYTNNGFSLHWLHRFNGIHKMDFSYAMAGYNFHNKNRELDIAAYEQDYSFNHNELRLNFTITPTDQHKITYGINSVLYNVMKGDIIPLDEGSLVQSRSFDPEKGVETGIYFSEEWEINKHVAMEAGFRYNIYNVLGPSTVYEYPEGSPRELSSITDTLFYGNNKIIKTYHAPDFRFGIKYQPTTNLSFKAGYNRLHQYLFLMSNTIAIAPTDMWKLCDYNIRPMKGDQYSVGVYANLWQGALELSAEAYYKKAFNIAEFKDGASFYMNNVPETGVLQGILNSKGLEFMIKKTTGQWTGWVNYTYSKSVITGIDDFTGDQINFGNPFPSNYDKPHAVNMVLNFKPNRRVSLSGNITYSTGRPITYPTTIYYVNGQQYLNYSGRNEYRLPDYFRADLSLKIEGNLLSKKLAHGTFIVSVYNLTGRKNAYSVYFKTVEGVVKGYKLSVFGSPIPSITYNFKLGNYAN